MALRRALLVAAAALFFSACPKRVPDRPVTRSGPPRAYLLLQETPERETTQIDERREDVEVDTRDFDRVPHVVAKGETPVLQLDGARARLYGDAQQQAGWSVDNFVLIEVLDAQDHLIACGNAGFAEGVLMGNQRVDNLGRMAFQFEPGEVDITRLLPESEPFKLRATALDNGGVGRVTNLFVVLEYPDRDRGEDDLRE